MSTILSKTGEPTWEVAYLFPEQGNWSEAAYLALRTNQLVELVDGRLEVLPMPTELHQLIVACLFRALDDFVTAGGLGTTLFAPLRVQVAEGRYREPDVVFLAEGNWERRGNDFWRGADLVVEVVGDDDPNRDWVEKLADYARAGIGEYWIADPRDSTITVHALDTERDEYEVAGRYSAGETATSILLNGFAVAVTEVFERG